MNNFLFLFILHSGKDNIGQIGDQVYQVIPVKHYVAHKKHLNLNKGQRQTKHLSLHIILYNPIKLSPTN